MNYGQKNYFLYALLSAALGFPAAYGSTEVSGPIEVSIETAKDTVGIGEQIMYVVEVRNTGTEAAPVDVVVDWPTKCFAATITTRYMGQLQELQNGMRWYGFMLEPGQVQMLTVRSVDPYYEAYLSDTLTATVESVTKSHMVRKLVFSIDPEDTSATKLGFGNPNTDYIVAVVGFTVTIQVLANDTCPFSPPTSPLVIREEPEFGTAVVSGSTIEYTPSPNLIHPNGPVKPNQPLNDYLEYEVGDGASPEYCGIQSVFITIYHPQSPTGILFQSNS